jgi:eukaryotic-like serine/threonine-protein kinase
MPAVCPKCGQSTVGTLGTVGTLHRCPHDGADIEAARLMGVSTTIDNAASELGPRVPSDAPPAEPTDPLIGTRVDKYEIESVLGRGGMGTVYLVRHIDLGHQLALKVLDSRLWTSSDVSARFFQEAKAAARIGHPNIVQIFDFAKHSTAGSYIVMELLRGDPLDVLLKQEAPLPEQRAIGIALQICDALASAHKLGIVHRDLKPANIFVSPMSLAQTPHGSSAGDVVKVMDFGVAKISESASAVSTRPGTLVGTPLYMSPEQWESGPTDARTDVYSLGLVLYEMLTGLLPHQGTLTQVVKSLTLDEARPPSAHRKDLTPALSNVVMRAIRKRPADRHATMDELASDLRAVRERRAGSTLVPPPPRFWRDRRLFAAAVAFVAVAGIAIAVTRRPARAIDAAQSSAAPPAAEAVVASPAIPLAPVALPTAASTPSGAAPVVVAARQATVPNRTTTTPRAIPASSASPSGIASASASAPASASATASSSETRRPPRNLLFGE